MGGNMQSKISTKGCGSIISFPEEGYPTNLTSLRLKGVNIGKQVFEWGLHRLTSLTYLRIDDGFPDWQSFPSEEEDGKMMMTLPTSLTTLYIWKLPNIVFLSSKGFQNLSALQDLWIDNCPKLEFLPEKGLPPSLLHLYISDCPLLKQHCKKGKGREWLKIANIPEVQIDGRAVWFGSNLTLRSDLFNPLLHYGFDSKLVTEIKNNNDSWTKLFYTFAITGCGRFEIFKNKAATEGSEINAVSMLDYSKEMEQLRREDYSLKKDQVINLREVLWTWQVRGNQGWQLLVMLDVMGS
ncbi:putative disease resistance RPP13-like protein 1 [Fagus crenata]